MSQIRSVEKETHLHRASLASEQSMLHLRLSMISTELHQPLAVWRMNTVRSLLMYVNVVQEGHEIHRILDWFLCNFCQADSQGLLGSYTYLPDCIFGLGKD